MKDHTFTMIANGFRGMRDMFVGASVAMSLVSFFVPRAPR